MSGEEDKTLSSGSIPVQMHDAEVRRAYTRRLHVCVQPHSTGLGGLHRDLFATFWQKVRTAAYKVP